MSQLTMNFEKRRQRALASVERLMPELLRAVAALGDGGAA